MMIIFRDQQNDTSIILRLQHFGSADKKISMVTEETDIMWPWLRSHTNSQAIAKCYYNLQTYLDIKLMTNNSSTELH